MNIKKKIPLPIAGWMERSDWSERHSSPVCVKVFLPEKENPISAGVNVAPF